MAFSGGVFSRLYNWVNDANNAINIRADRMDAEMDGFATGLSDCVTRDGQSPATADLPMGTFKHTNVGNATASNHYAAVGQVQSGAFVWGGTTGGTTTAYTITLYPAITAYTAGQVFSFIVNATNTGASTLNINALGAQNIYKGASTALVAGDMLINTVLTVKYDGTQFQLQGIDDMNINMNNNTLTAPNIKGGSIQEQTVAAATSTTLDYSAGSWIILTTASAITTLTINNWPASGTAGVIIIERVHENSGTSYAVTWPAAVKWTGGVAPTLTQTANSVDIIALTTRDGGTTIRGTLIGSDYR